MTTDLEARRVTSADPGVLREALRQLTRLGIELPAEVHRAVGLLDRLSSGDLDAGGRPVVDGAELLQMSPEQVAGLIHQLAAYQAVRRSGELPGAQREVMAAIAGHVAGILYDSLDEVLTQLGPRFEASAAVIRSGATAGLTAGMSADDAVELGDEAVAAWRDTAIAATELDVLVETLRQLACGLGLWDHHSGFGGHYELRIAPVFDGPELTAEQSRTPRDYWTALAAADRLHMPTRDDLITRGRR